MLFTLRGRQKASPDRFDNPDDAGRIVDVSDVKEFLRHREVSCGKVDISVGGSTVA